MFVYLTSQWSGTLKIPVTTGKTYTNSAYRTYSCGMRTIATDDDRDGSGWSMETLDIDCQRADCKGGQTDTSNNLQRVRTVMNMYRPYLANTTSCLHGIRACLLNDFSTKVAVSGTQSTGQEMVKCAYTPNTSTGVDGRDSAYCWDKLRKANEIKFDNSCSVEYTTLAKRKQMNLSHPVSHRTSFRQTIVVMNRFNFKRSTNSPGRINQYHSREIHYRVHRHRTAREAKPMKENRRFVYIPSWNTNTLLP